MPTIHAHSDGGVPRDLDVETRENEVFLHAHPPGNLAEGQDILVPRELLIRAIHLRQGQIAGFSQVKRTAKECVIAWQTDGIRVEIHPASGSGSWWVIVNADALVAAVG